MWEVAQIINLSDQPVNQELVFQAGGGTHAHDLGTFGGSKSLVQARDAIKKGWNKLQAISNGFELLLAFRKWGKPTYVEWLKSLAPESTVVVQADERPLYAPGREQGQGPAAVPLKEAMVLWPPLREDLLAHNPGVVE
jgi:hypothetical protein